MNPAPAVSVQRPSDERIDEASNQTDSLPQHAGYDSDLLKEQQQSLDSDKQVVSSEESTGPSNAPMVSVEDDTAQQQRLPEYEADKVVVNSWQSSPRNENAPISMAYHENSQQQGNFLNDIKGPPPDYEKTQSIERDSDELVAAHSPIEPDNSSSTHPHKPEDRTAVGQLLSWIPNPPPASKKKRARLVQPIVIPQLDVPPSGESVPFSRCYSDALAAYDVSMRDFLAFLDGLALARAPNAALQSLKLFGVGVTAIPIPLIPLAGRSLSSLATSGSGHSGGRATLYLERAKKEYFAPRGLSLSIVRDGDLSTRLQIPAHAARLAPLTKNSLTETCCRRRLNGLAPYVAPLKFDVPEPDKQLQGVHKMARKHLDSRFKEQARRLSRLREDQWEGVSTIWSEMAGWEEDYAYKMDQTRRIQDDIVHEQLEQEPSEKNSLNAKIGALQDLQRQLQLLESQRYMAIQNAVGNRKGVEAEIEEVNWSRKLKWLVIEDLQMSYWTR